ncbi:MAG: hypothetical protein HRT61_24030, partial [Ekhidna sp.]|nr:hypothetical protein [Ekhidna sp.]
GKGEVLRFSFETAKTQTYKLSVMGVDPPRKKNDFEIQIILDDKSLSATSKSTVRHKFEDHNVGEILVEKGLHTIEISFSREEALDFLFEKLVLVPN